MRFFKPNESDPDVATAPVVVERPVVAERRVVVERPVVTEKPVLTEKDVKAAYERGRRDERDRRKGHPVLALMVFVIALIGAGMIYLAAREGSFSGGGQVIDQGIAKVTGRAQVAREDTGSTISRAGEKLQAAGQSLSQGR